MSNKIKGVCSVLLSLALLAPTVMPCAAETVEEIEKSEDVIETYEFVLPPKI